jgi:hypothetical protein
LIRRTLAVDLSVRLGVNAIADPGLPLAHTEVQRIKISILALKLSRQGVCVVEAS